VKPEQLLFAKTHEWCYVETDSTGAKVATVGVSAFALDALTDLVYIQLPEVGRQLKAGEAFGEIESVKAVSDLYSPVDGQVTAVHEGLGERLEKLGADAYGEGWMLKIKLSGETALRNLMDYAAYQKQCEEEGH
jgi:glycine cleavage system H protein